MIYYINKLKEYQLCYIFIKNILKLYIEQF